MAKRSPLTSFTNEKAVKMVNNHIAKNAIKNIKKNTNKNIVQKEKNIVKNVKKKEKNITEIIIRSIEK